MKTLEQISSELLGEVVFQKGDKPFSAFKFTFGTDERTHKPVVMFMCRFEHNGQPVEDYVVRKLDFEDRRLDRTIECGSVIESLPEYEAIAGHIDYILEANGLTRENLVQAALKEKTHIDADVVTDIMRGINELYLSQKDVTAREMKNALQNPMVVSDALKEYVAGELKFFIDKDLPLPEGFEQYTNPPEHGIKAEPLVDIFEKNLCLNVFETASMRLHINGLEPCVVSEHYVDHGKLNEYDVHKPAVRITADIIKESGSDSYTVEVPLDFDAYHGVYESEEDTLMNGVDEILEAFGLDRERILRAVEGDSLVLNNLSSSMRSALVSYLEDGIPTTFGDKQRNEEWAQIAGQIADELNAGKNLRLRFAWENDFGNAPGYSVAVEDDDHAQIFEAQPQEELTRFQQFVLDLFSQQKMYPEEIPELIAQEKLHLPEALLKAAQQRYKDCIREQARKYSAQR